MPDHEQSSPGEREGGAAATVAYTGPDFRPDWHALGRRYHGEPFLEDAAEAADWDIYQAYGDLAFDDLPPAGQAAWFRAAFNHAQAALDALDRGA